MQDLPGKYIALNNGDTDGDGVPVPNFADGFDKWGNAGTNAGGQFTPMMFELKGPIDPARAMVRFTFSGSDPSAITRIGDGSAGNPYVFTPAKGSLRLWKVDGTNDRKTAQINAGGDFVGSGVVYAATDFGFGKTNVVYVEGIRDSAGWGDRRILMEVDPKADGHWISADAVRCTVISVDEDVDSDNNNGYDPPDRSDLEDQIEAMTNRMGKALKANDGDEDHDGIPDWADGFDVLGSATNADDVATNRFVPVVWEIPAPIDISKTRLRLTYPASDPAKVKYNAKTKAWTLPAGYLRLWRKDGIERRNKGAVDAFFSPGDYIPGGTYKDISVLGFSTGQRVITNYIESVRLTNILAGLEMKIEVDPDGSGPAGWMLVDDVRFTTVRVRLYTDSNNDGTIETNDVGECAYKQYWPGRILPVDGHGIDSDIDYLAEIRLAIEPALNTGTAKLEALTNAGCIKVWTTTNKTTEVTLPKTYDLASTSLPTSLYVDGINTGKVMLALSYSSGSFSCTDQVAMLIIPTISYAPGKGTNAFVWAPLMTMANNNRGNNLGWADATEFENQIKEQGWPTVTWFSDTTGDTDTNFGSCTLANYKGMTNCGIFTVTSHGDKGCHPAVYAQYSPAGLTAISNWCAGETGITIDPWRPNPTDPAWLNGCYVARVSSSWFMTNWKPGMDANRAIGIWSICFSATANGGTGEGAVKECVGGRWRVGYELTTYEDEDVFVNRTLLSRLNGTTNAATKRTCGDAWGETSSERDDYKWQRPDPPTDNGLLYRSVIMNGNDWTTLCPSPLVTNAVFPDATAENRKGWGCILFDTYMCNTNAATNALQKITGCPTTNYRWFGNTNGTYGLGFDFDKTGGAATTMRVVANKCRNEGAGGGRELDGDRVKPSKDNRDWSF